MLLFQPEPRKRVESAYLLWFRNRKTEMQLNCPGITWTNKQGGQGWRKLGDAEKSVNNSTLVMINIGSLIQ